MNTGKATTMTPQETARRLRLLAERLRTVPLEHFDMGTWCGMAGNNKTKELVVDRKYEKLSLDRAEPRCGTRACALGWATTIPELELQFVGFGPCQDVVIVHQPDVTLTTPRDFDDDSDVTGYHAAVRAFGVTISEAHDLFDPPCRDSIEGDLEFVLRELEETAARYDSKPAEAT